MKLDTTLCFDDVLLKPQISDIKSRKEVDISSSLGHYRFRLPIISSPMDTITEVEMSEAIARSGGFGIVHRYNTIEEQVSIISSTERNIGAAIGVTGDFLERAKALVEAGCFILCIDVAHGHHQNVKTALETLKQEMSSETILMAGNVATSAAFRDLEDWGADVIRVGVGGGSICSTRIQTGHGVPTLQSVLDCAQVAKTAKIVADGGIKASGDIVKCLAAGADFVMLGSLLAGTDESPGQIFHSNEGKKYKVYRGMASVEAQVDWKGAANSLEGISTTIPYKGSVQDILIELSQNVRSGLSYSGCRSIKEFRSKAIFVRQTQAGMRESNTHILNK
jgi:IMP dehydrogenase